MGVLVSVIIPLYNAEKYIKETIESVLKQDYENIELIVIDDGSKDHSKEVVLSIKDDRIRYIHQENAGVSVARNNGFKESKGEYLAFLDADDVLTTDCISKKIERFKEDDELGLVHGDMQVVDDQTKPMKEVYRGKEGWILKDLLSWKDTCIPSPSSVLVKREVLDVVSAFDTDLSTAADQEFFFRVAHKFKIGKVNKVLGYYRMHDNNMHSNIEVMESDHILAFIKAKEYGFFENVNFEKKCFANLYKTIGASYWKNAGDKFKGAKFLLKALILDPLILLKR